MRNLFLVLGLGWFLGALYQYLGTDDPYRDKVALQFLGMAAINFAVAGFLTWLRDRRQKAER